MSRLSVRLSVSECVRRWICLCDYLCLALTACLLQVGPWLSASTVFLCLRLPMSVHLSERRIIFPYNVRPERGNLPWIFSDILLNAVIILLLTINGYETFKILKTEYVKLIS